MSHLWVYDKRCGTSYAPKFCPEEESEEELECTFPEENVNGACSGKTRHSVARVFLGNCYGVLGDCYAVARVF